MMIAISWCHDKRQDTSAAYDNWYLAPIRRISSTPAGLLPRGGQVLGDHATSVGARPHAGGEGRTLSRIAPQRTVKDDEFSPADPAGLALGQADGIASASLRR
jgi:hypothetical protein